MVNYTDYLHLGMKHTYNAENRLLRKTGAEVAPESERESPIDALDNAESKEETLAAFDALKIQIEAAKADPESAELTMQEAMDALDRNARKLEQYVAEAAFIALESRVKMLQSQASEEEAEPEEQPSRSSDSEIAASDAEASDSPEQEEVTEEVRARRAVPNPEEGDQENVGEDSSSPAEDEPAPKEQPQERTSSDVQDPEQEEPKPPKPKAKPQPKPKPAPKPAPSKKKPGKFAEFVGSAGTVAGSTLESWNRNAIDGVKVASDYVINNKGVSVGAVTMLALLGALKWFSGKDAPPKLPPEGESAAGSSGMGVMKMLFGGAALWTAFSTIGYVHNRRGGSKKLEQTPKNPPAKQAPKDDPKAAKKAVEELQKPASAETEEETEKPLFPLALDHEDLDFENIIGRPLIINGHTVVFENGIMEMTCTIDGEEWTLKGMEAEGEEADKTEGLELMLKRQFFRKGINEHDHVRFGDHMIPDASLVGLVKTLAAAKPMDTKLAASVKYGERTEKDNLPAAKWIFERELPVEKHSREIAQELPRFTDKELAGQNLLELGKPFNVLGHVVEFSHDALNTRITIDGKEWDVQVAPQAAVVDKKGNWFSRKLRKFTGSETAQHAAFEAVRAGLSSAVRAEDEYTTLAFNIPNLNFEQMQYYFHDTALQRIVKNLADAKADENHVDISLPYLENINYKEGAKIFPLRFAHTQPAKVADIEKPAEAA